MSWRGRLVKGKEFYGVEIIMNSNDVEIHSIRDLPAIRDHRTQEIARMLFNLRQRFDSSSNYRTLVSSIKYFETPLVQQIRHVKIDSGLEPYLQKTASLAGLTEIMDYQLEAWKKIHSLSQSNQRSSIIVSAETGMGKTEAVIPVIANEVINSDTLAIIIFPRRALLKDQLQRIAKYNYNFARQSNITTTPLKFAIQMGGVSEKIYWTAYADTTTDEITEKNYEIETDFLIAKYKDDEFDELSLIDIRCPICDQNLSWQFRFKKHVRGYGRDTRSAQANHFKGINGINYLWKCPNHENVKYSISLSREDHVLSKPNIIFTTIDSLESLLLDPIFGEYVKSKTKYIVLDEVHAYSGIYGAHASAILRELTIELKNNPLYVGLSATITDPEKFATNLFGTEVKDNCIIFPSNNDKVINNQQSSRKFFLMKSKFHEQRFYPMSTQVMIQSALILASTLSSLQNQALVFMDSIDAVSRLLKQSQDAYNRKKLHNLRLDDLINYNATFDAHRCKTYVPYECSNGCYIYEQGECWALARYRSGFINSPTTINILGVTASSPHSRMQLMNSSLIYSTSELELGVDLPNITYLFQYGSPYTVTSFIQRVGRAGRGRDSQAVIGVILGEKTSDYIYFRKGSDILNEPLSTPLNNKNDVIRGLHHEIVRISKMAINEILQDTTQRKEYVKEITDTWKVIFNEFSASFQREMDILGIQNRLIAQSGWDDIKLFKRQIGDVIDPKIQELKRNIENLLAESGIDPREHLKNKSDELFTDLSKFGIDVRDAALKVDRFLAEYNLPPIQRDLAAKKAELIKALDSLVKTAMDSTALRKANFFKQLSDIHSTLETDMDLSITHTDEIRALFYRIQFYSELKSSFGKSSLLEIVKDSLRAKYFLEVSENFFVQGSVPFPQNFFELTRFYCIIKQRGSNDTDKISIDGVIFKYFPFRVNYNPNNDFGEVVLPRVTKLDSGLVFSIGSYLDYIHLSDPQESPFAFPRMVTFERYQTEPNYGLLKYCHHCIRFYSFRWRGPCESCGNNLQYTRVYSSPIVDSSIYADEWLQKTKRVYISENATLTRLLTGVSLTLTPAISINDNYILKSKNALDMYIEAEMPYGYNIKTWSIRISIDKNTIDEMINGFKAEFPAIGNRLSDNVLLEMSIHTISHLWMLLCSEYSQVSAETFSYDWTTQNENYFVYISENQEGGAGFFDEVYQILQFYPKRVYDSLHSLLNCDEHQSISSLHRSGNSSVSSLDIYNWIRNNLPTGRRLSERQEIMSDYSKELNIDVDEVMNEYPTCIDGCSNCIAIEECRNGGNEQSDHISLKMAHAYLNSISMVVKDKDALSDLIKQGMKIIEEIDGGNGGYLIIDL